MSEKVCQGCGKVIKLGEQVVEVRVGTMSCTARYYKVDATSRDFFHRRCSIAIAGSEE